MHGEPTTLAGGGEIERALASVEEALMNVKEALGGSDEANIESNNNSNSSNGPNSPAVGRAYISRYVLASTPSPKLSRKTKEVSDSEDDDEDDDDDDEVVHFVIRRPSLPKKQEDQISYNINSAAIGQGSTRNVRLFLVACSQNSQNRAANWGSGRSSVLSFNLGPYISTTYDSCVNIPPPPSLPEKKG